MSQGRTTSGGSRAYLFQLLVALGTLVAISFQFLPPSSHELPMSPLRMLVRFRAHPNPGWSHLDLYLITSEDFSQIRAQSQVPCVLGATISLVQQTL